jgi:hypothetical protein
MSRHTHVTSDVPIVKVRLMGQPDVVAHAADRLRSALTVIDESRDYENRPPSTGVRRYLDVLVDGADVVGEGGHV